MAGHGRGRGGGAPGRGGFGRRTASEQPRVFENGRYSQPDTEVAKLEDSMVQDGLSARMAASSIDSSLPARPGYGTAGQPIVLHANYVELKAIKPDAHLYRYSVAFTSMGQGS